MNAGEGKWVAWVEMGRGSNDVGGKMATRSRKLEAEKENGSRGRD